MQPGDDKVVADRLHAVLSQKRSPKSSAPPAPAANLSGRWEVNVEFFSSKSRHTLFLMQEGNRIQGSHQGDYSTRDVYGTIEGNQIKLRSQASAPGDSVGFIFAGTLAGDTISGPIYMGEYLNARFTAKRSNYPAGPANDSHSNRTAARQLSILIAPAAGFVIQDHSAGTNSRTYIRRIYRAKSNDIS